VGVVLSKRPAEADRECEYEQSLDHECRLGLPSFLLKRE
jgi:hypothetical protein